MKRILYAIFVTSVIAAAFAMTGCRSMSHNGRLDGFWKIVTIENTATGEVTPANSEYYYSFYRDVMNLKDTKSVKNITGKFNYHKGDDKITIEYPYIESDQMYELEPYGIYENPVTFEILKLTGSELVLKSDHSIVSCIKF